MVTNFWLSDFFALPLQLLRACGVFPCLLPLNFRRLKEADVFKEACILCIGIQVYSGYYKLLQAVGSQVVLFHGYASLAAQSPG
jgi:hypothetical protein